MKFCANPKCLFYVDAPVTKWHHIIIIPEPVRPLSENISECAKSITREKYLWKNRRGDELFFCDVCYEAIKVIERS